MKTVHQMCQKKIKIIKIQAMFENMMQKDIALLFKILCYPTFQYTRHLRKGKKRRRNKKEKKSKPMFCDCFRCTILFITFSSFSLLSYFTWASDPQQISPTFVTFLPSDTLLPMNAFIPSSTPLYRPYALTSQRCPFGGKQWSTRVLTA